MRKTLARLAIGVIDPQAWVIDDTGQAKEVTVSACVARQYSGTLGKIGNCQVAVSVHAVTDAASAPLDWRLYVPESLGRQVRHPPEGRRHSVKIRCHDLEVPRDLVGGT